MISQTFLVFMTLTVLKNIDQVFWRIDLNSDLPDVFLLVRLELCFVGKKITEVKCHSQHIKTEICTINMTYLLYLMLILITWLQAVYVGFLCCKVTLFSPCFQFCTFLRGDPYADSGLKNLRAESLHKIFEILLLERFVSSPSFL